MCWIICGHLLVPPHCCGLPMFNCASNCRAARAPRKLGQLWTTWQQLTHFIGNNYSETVWKCVEYCVSAFYAKLFLWKTKPHGGPAQPPMVKKFIHFSQSRLIKIFKTLGDILMKYNNALNGICVSWQSCNVMKKILFNFLGCCLTMFYHKI